MTSPQDRQTHNARLLAKARERFCQLVGEAERTEFYGAVAIEATIEAGRISVIRRRIEGTDR